MVLFDALGNHTRHRHKQRGKQTQQTIPHIHKVKDPADVFAFMTNTSMRQGPSDGPTVRRAVQADVGAATGLHQLLAIPATGIGAVLIRGQSSAIPGVSASGGNQNPGAGMPPDGVHRFEQNTMLAERRFPAFGADSSRHTQTKLPLLQQDQLTAGKMQHQLLRGRVTNSSRQQGQCLSITKPGGNRWNWIRRPGVNRPELKTGSSENHQQRRPKHWT